MAEKYQTLPYVTIEVSDANPQALFEAGLGELAGLEGLEGWKIFKKIGRAFKKVGHKIKKFKFAKIFKVAIPFAAGAVLGPLAAAGGATLAKKFGGKIAGLIKGGRIIPQKIMTAKGPAVALLNSREGQIIKKAVGSLGKTLTDRALQKLLGQNPQNLIAPGATIDAGKINLPVLQSTPTVTTETISAQPGFLSKHGTKLIIGGATLVTLPFLIKALRK